MTRRHAPLTHDKPERRAQQAASHFCEAVGSTIFCEPQDCPYCGDDQERSE